MSRQAIDDHEARIRVLEAQHHHLTVMVGELLMSKLTAQERQDAVTIVRGAAALFGFSIWSGADFAARAAEMHLSGEFDDAMARLRDRSGGLRSLGRFLGRIAGLPVCELTVNVIGQERAGCLYVVGNAGFSGKKPAPAIAGEASATDDADIERTRP